MVYLVQILYSYIFQHFPATGMKKCDEASPSIILAGQALLSKILITLEPHGIFCSIFYTYVFKHCLATGMQNGHEA